MKKREIPEVKGMRQLFSYVIEQRGGKPFSSKKEFEKFMEAAIDAGKMPMFCGNAKEEAEELIDEAWEASGKERVELAMEAIELYPDCTDAYVILAGEADTIEDSKEIYEIGIKTGKKEIGEKQFKKYEGHFWGIIETRPFMRACEGLADCLWQLGKKQNSIQAYNEMLRLNPNDNQGVRTILISHLLEIGEDKAAEELLKKYEKEIFAAWSYSHALLNFRRGNKEKALIWLQKAVKVNKHVPKFLLGEKKMPKELPEYISPGDETEAIEYCDDGIPAWKKADGTLEWLKEMLDEKDLQV